MAPTVTKWPVSGENHSAANYVTAFSEMLGDFISSGFTATDGGGLLLTVAAGVGYCAGKRHSVSGPNSLTMGKSTTNYIYYDPVTEDFHIDTDASMPTNALYIAKVVVGASTITTITDMRTMMESGLAMPIGAIVIWSGATTSVPQGWLLCDGTGGTPNLRDNFIVGAGTSYVLTNTGGTTSHSLQQGGSGTGGGSKIYQIDGTNSGSITQLPPYYALAYIIRVS